MRAAELLLELADSHYEILVQTTDHYGLHYFFETRTGDEYKVQILWDGPLGQVSVEFALRQGVEWADHVTGGAGTESLRVFSTVIHCVKDAIAREPEIDTITFDATFAEPSRVALYRRFAANASRYLPGWRYVGEKGREWSGGRSGNNYVITRKPKTILSSPKA